MIAVLLLLAAAATPTLEEVTRLPPAAAGDLALAGYPHAPIVEVRPGPGGLVPPGVAELTMVERPTALSGEGCFRQYWNVSFRRDPEGPPAPQRLVGAQSYTEVATRSGEGCPSTGYVGANPGVSPAVAVAELARLHDWQAGIDVPEYRCVDRTYSDFCASPEKTRQEVAQLTPWMVSRDLLYIEIWLGTRGGIVTELRYVPDDHVSSVTVTRSVPAPF